MTLLSASNVLLAIGLSAFFGIAFEGHYARVLPNRPGGIRTFPLLALCGAVLYALEPRDGLPFTAGALVVGAWTFAYYRSATSAASRGQGAEGHYVVPVCNLLAYGLGAFTLIAPAWASIGITVTAVLFLAGRERLHTLAQSVAAQEILTAAQFLLLIGVVLPLLPHHPTIGATGITPYGVWLAVVAVSTLSYGSYLLQRYVFPTHGALLGAVLGGLYSSTATTVVLSKRLAESGVDRELEAGIVLASSVMYLRLLIVIAVFSFSVLRVLLLPMIVLSALGLSLTGFLLRMQRTATAPDKPRMPVANPLELTTALFFAACFVVISLISNWVQRAFGHTGLYWLAAIVGVADVDPFVLSLVQGSVQALGATAIAVAVLIAAASNNVAKAVYAWGFGRRNAGASAIALIVLSAFTLLGALGVARFAH
ncbi:MAG: MgtC/SapB family protein [Vulcanimicrobiaceae bacterium]